MLDNTVTRAGTLLFKGGRIYIDGWELKEPGMCREHVIFACMYVAQELYKAAMANIREPGGAKNTCADMPRETPRDWLCEETREFLEEFDGTPEPRCQLLLHVFTEPGQHCLCGAVPWGQPSNTVVDVRDVACPACGKPMQEHKGDISQPGAVLWCP